MSGEHVEELTLTLFCGTDSGFHVRVTASVESLLNFINTEFTILVQIQSMKSLNHNVSSVRVQLPYQSVHKFISRDRPGAVLIKDCKKLVSLWSSATYPVIV
jgi:hypothetical protein